MQIAQSRVDEDLLAVGEKQMTEALYSSESQPPVFNNPEHDFLPVPGEHTQSCDLWIYYISIVALALGGCIFSSSYGKSDEYSKASQALSRMGDGHIHFKTNDLIRL